MTKRDKLTNPKLNQVLNLDQKLDFTLLENISGHDSQVEIAKIGETKFVLKTFRQKKILQKRMTPIAKRNLEFYYQIELQGLGLPHLEFVHLEKTQKDQLCMKYLENLQTFAIADQNQFRNLGEFIRNLVEISQSQNTKIVTENGVEIKDKNDYFVWLHNFIAKRSMENHFVQKALQIIEELRQKTEYLTLLHSDFHASNIGLVDEQILLFDSGECPYLFGHLYHDITRLVMYEPSGIIFENGTISPNLAAFLQPLNEFVKDVDFLKFCYIQSILMVNNSFITRRREITEYLFGKLV